jgi:hypothetical protein
MENFANPNNDLRIAILKTKSDEGSKIAHWFGKRSISYQGLNLNGRLPEESASFKIKKVLLISKSYPSRP